MKKIKLNKYICLAVVAITLIVGVCVENAMAYFTTYVTAEGQVTMNLGFTETVPDDDVADKTKTVSVTNNDDFPCFVRLKVFWGNQFNEYIEIEGGTGWSLNNGYYEYDSVLEPDAKTNDFVIDLTEAMQLKPTDDDIDEFNVIVIQESTPVLYTDDGVPYADWSIPTVENEGGTESENGEGAAN